MQLPLLNPLTKWVATYIGDPMGTWDIGVTVLDAVDLRDVMIQLLDQQALKGHRHTEVWAVSVVHADPYDVAVGVDYRAGGPLKTDFHAVELPLHAVQRWMPGPPGPNRYVVSGTVGEDDERFAQALPGHSQREAVDVVERYFTSQGWTSIHPWSVVEWRPDGQVSVGWVLQTKAGRAASFPTGRLVFPVTPFEAPQIACAPRDVQPDLEYINRHRASIYQAPLDPVASGWGPDDIVAEAHRIHRLRNPAKPKLGPRETLLVRWGTPVGGDEYTDVRFEPTKGHRIGHTWAVTRTLEERRGKIRPGRGWTLTHFPSGRRALEEVDKYVAVALGQRLVELGYDSMYGQSPSSTHFPGLSLIIGNVRGRLGMDKAQMLEYIGDLQTEDFGELAQMEYGGYTPEEF